MYIYENPNPENKVVGDCVIRAISILLNKSWEEIYDDLTEQGRMMYDMPSSNEVWAEYLYSKGFTRKIIPDTCPACYTIWQFCEDHPIGKYLLATGSHVVAVINGNYHDSWDSGNEVPIYFFKRRKN